MARTPYRRRDTSLTDLMLKERQWCGRHRFRYLAWKLVDGKPWPAKCSRCVDEEAAAKPVPMGTDHG